MLDVKNLPYQINEIVKDMPYKIDNIGRSDAVILIFDEMVLKIEKVSSKSDKEYSAISWLQGRLPVPEIMKFVQSEGYNYILMSRLSGEMSCSEKNLQDINKLVIALADGLKMLWNVDINNCPFMNNLDAILKIAKYNIDNNLVDIDDFNDDTLGEDGFKDVDDLYDFLLSNKPEEDCVFTHGDYCLPNVFMENGSVSGFLDLGKAGIADRWQDIALCVRSLKYNVCDYFGKSESEFEKYKDMLYSQLGIAEDKQKLKYYILLDELF